MANTIYNIITIEPAEAMDKICDLRRFWIW